MHICDTRLPCACSQELNTSGFLHSISCGREGHVTTFPSYTNMYTCVKYKKSALSILGKSLRSMFIRLGGVLLPFREVYAYVVTMSIHKDRS